MNLQVLNVKGEPVETLEVSDALFGAPINEAVVHQVMVAQLANARQGTADTKTRDDVSGGGKKPRPQKYTGRSRQGSITAPQWSGGGIVFGPHPRSYRQKVTKRLRRLAIRAMLSDKAKENSLIVLKGFELAESRTKAVKDILKGLKIEEGTSVLLVTNEAETNLVKAARNLAKVGTLPAPLLNVVDLMNHKKVVMTVDAVRKAEELWAGPLTRGKKNIEAEARN